MKGLPSTVALLLLLTSQCMASHQGHFRGLGISYDSKRGEGLFNQHYNALATLASAVLGNGTFVLLPKFMTRLSKMEVHDWVKIDLEQVYDVEHLQRSMQHMYGIEVRTNLNGIHESTICRGPQYLTGCSDRDLHMDEVQYARDALNSSFDKAWLGCLNSGRFPSNNKNNVTVLLGHHNPFGFWRWSKLPPSIPENLHKALRFSKRIRDLASEAILRLKENQYNGMHLRMEGDSGHWIKACGSFIKDVPTLYWSMYYQAAAKLGLNTTLPMYVAAGPAELKTPMMAVFKDRFASHVYTKSDLLPPEKLAGLGVDQLAAVDFLVLNHAQKAIGFPLSSFSVYLESSRFLHGHDPLTTFKMADGSKLLWALARREHGWGLFKLIHKCWSLQNYPEAAW